MGTSNSKRARKRRDAVASAVARIARRNNAVREACESLDRLHNKWHTVPTGVLMYHLRTLRPARPLKDSFGIETRLNSNKKSYSFVWDAPQGFVLTRNSKPCACIGFRIVKDVVVVEQIQGLKEGKDFFLPFNWSAVLLDAVVYTAYVLGYRRVEVVPASHNRWSKYRRKDVYQRFVRLYDGTAQALRFVQYARDGNFRMLLR